MSIVLPNDSVQSSFEARVLNAWYEAHGEDSGRISTSWGEDRVVVMIEEVWFKGELLLLKDEDTTTALENYGRELLGYIVDNQARQLSKLLNREIISTSINVNAQERWVMFIFWLGETEK